MPFGFSFGGSKSNTNSSFTGTDTYDKNTNFNQTSTPTNPDWVSSGAQNIFTGAQSLAGANPQNYVAGPNAQQLQAGQSASNLNGTPWNYEAALGKTGQVMNSDAPQMQAATASPYINNYLNPYVDQVVNTANADFDANAGQTRAQQALQMAHSGAFGGSGAAITQSLTEGQLARARATQDATLRAQGYDTALGAAQQDASRQQEANSNNAQLVGQQYDRALTGANQLGNLSSTYEGNQRADAATQAAVGDSLHTIQQQQATAPLDLQAWLQQNFSGLPLNLFQGQTQVGTQNEDGTENQSGTSKGKTTGLNFGFTAGK